MKRQYVHKLYKATYMISRVHFGYKNQNSRIYVEDIIIKVIIMGKYVPHAQIFHTLSLENKIAHDYLPLTFQTRISNYCSILYN